MSDSKAFVIRSLLLFACVFCMPAFGANVAEQVDSKRDQTVIETDEVWKEGAATLPAVPTADGLIEVDENLLDGPNRVQIVGSSIDIGSDGVVRYVVQISSPSGARNVLFEGIRCSGWQYRTIAYAGLGKKFRQLSRSRWKKITYAGQSYRRVLAEFFLCADDGWPLKIAEIHTRLNNQAKSVAWSKRSVEGTPE